MPSAEAGKHIRLSRRVRTGRRPSTPPSRTRQRLRTAGLWAAQGGYEYNLVLISALLALAEDKPGDVSVDNALGLQLTGFKWSMAALALGTAASGAIIWLGQQQTASQSSSELEPGQPAS